MRRLLIPLLLLPAPALADFDGRVVSTDASGTVNLERQVGKAVRRLRVRVWGTRAFPKSVRDRALADKAFRESIKQPLKRIADDALICVCPIVSTLILLELTSLTNGGLRLIQRGSDPDGTLVCDVKLNAGWLSHLLVADGTVLWNRREARNNAKLASLERKAKQQTAGYWAWTNTAAPTRRNHGRQKPAADALRRESGRCHSKKLRRVWD